MNDRYPNFQGESRMPTAMDSLTQLAWFVMSHYDIFGAILLFAFVLVIPQTLKEHFYMRKIRSLQRQNELIKSQSMSDIQTTKTNTSNLLAKFAYAIVWLNDEVEDVKDELNRFKADMANQLETIKQSIIKKPKHKPNHKPSPHIERRRNKVLSMKIDGYSNDEIVDEINKSRPPDKELSKRTIEDDITHWREMGEL